MIHNAWNTDSTNLMLQTFGFVRFICRICGCFQWNTTTLLSYCFTPSFYWVKAVGNALFSRKSCLCLGDTCNISQLYVVVDWCCSFVYCHVGSLWARLNHRICADWTGQWFAFLVPLKLEFCQIIDNCKSVVLWTHLSVRLVRYQLGFRLF